MRIFTITHKIVKLPPLDNCYHTLMVGAANKDYIPEDYLRDDAGDNISKFNDSYCELTGLYWMWKNVSDEIIGLVHYRRFFAKISGLRYHTKYIVLDKKKNCQFLTEEMIKKKLASCDILVKKSTVRKENNRKIIATQIKQEDIEIMDSVIKNSYFDYYYSYVQEMNEYFHLNCNMFIGKKIIVDQYCEWLFPLLFQIDQEHKRKVGARFHQRELGYLGEILFGVWLNRNKINYQICDVVNIGETQQENGIMSINEAFSIYSKKIFKH